MSLKVTKLNTCTLETVVGIGLIGFGLLPLVKRLVRCKVCNKKATSCFATSVGGFVLFCEPCFETFNVFYKYEIRQREEEGTILEDEWENYA
jgi:hypothetical protein